MTETATEDLAAAQVEKEIKEHLTALTAGHVAGCRINGHGILSALGKPEGWRTALALADSCGPRDEEWWRSPLGVVVSRSLAHTPDDAHPGLSRAEIATVLGVTIQGAGFAIDQSENGLTVVPASRRSKPWRWTVGSVHRYAEYSRIYKAGNRTAAAEYRRTLTEFQ